MDRPKIKTYQIGDVAKYAHLKYDGYYCRLLRTANVRGGFPVYYSKTGLELDVGQLSRTMLDIPMDVNVLGELVVRGKPASYVSTAIKNKEPLEYIVFAVQGGETLEACSLWCVRHGLKFAEYFGPDTTYGSSWVGYLQAGEVPDYKFVNHHAEGLVFKDGAFDNWRRYKPTKTIDLIVHDITDGEGKYLGLVGALVCKTAEGDIVANVSGFTDDERYSLSSKDIGRIVEVRYQYVGSKMRLRHPVFVRFRDDKLPRECTRDQDDDLANGLGGA